MSATSVRIIQAHGRAEVLQYRREHPRLSAGASHLEEVQASQSKLLSKCCAILQLDSYSRLRGYFFALKLFRTARAHGAKLQFPTAEARRSVMTSMNTLLGRLSCVVLFLFSVLAYGFGDTFETVRLLPVGSTPSAVAVGDFNHDGKLDMVVTNESDSSLSVLLGNGNGTFKPQKLIGLDGRPIAVVVGDFNGDGVLDVVALTTDLFVLLGNGDGTFRVGGMSVLGAQPLPSLVAADFNNDGKLDLAVADNQGVEVLLGNGDGTFQAAVEYSASNQPSWVATGDFNGDGKVDLVVSAFDQNFGTGIVNVFLGKGDGTFGSPIVTGNLKVGGGNVAVRDFNGDGKLDVAIGGPGSSQIAVVFGDGTGNFNNPEYISTTGADPSFVVTVDFNGDGKPDLIALNTGSSDVTVLFGNGKGKFSVGPNYAVGGGAFFPFAGSSPVVGDFNGDGRPDLAVANSLTNNVSVLLNLGGGRFAAAQDFRLLQVVESFVSAGDFNKDGKEDLAITDFQEVSILFGKGDGTFRAPVVVASGFGQFPVTGDFNGDGFPDLATAAGTTVSVLLNNGDGTFQPPKTFFAGPNITWLAAGDFNNDGKLDLVVCADKFVAVLLGNGDGTFQSPKDTSLPNVTFELAVGDFDGDGKLDLAVSNQVNGELSILMGNGDGTFGKPRNFNAGNGFLSIAVGDFNGDGKLDLAVVDFQFGSSNSSSVNVLLGNGDGAFGKAAKRGIGVQLSGTIATGDFNRDGKLDVVVGGSGADAYVFFGKGDGTLKPATPFGSAGGGSSLATGDFNRDGKPDVVVITEGGATILLNTSKKNKVAKNAKGLAPIQASTRLETTDNSPGRSPGYK
jgi:hypothetical protein